MANLKRNMIELVKEVKEGEIITEKFLTPVFIPMSVIYEAMDLMEKIDDPENEMSEKQTVDTLLDFVANKVYKDQFSKDDLVNGLHAPDAINVLQEQVLFIAQGQQTDATKEFLAKKR